MRRELVASALVVLTCASAFAQDPPDAALSDASVDAASALSTADAAAEAEAPLEAAAPDAPAPGPATMGEKQLFGLADGIRIVVQAPSDWREVEGEAAVVPELKQVRGAELEVSRTWSAPNADQGRLVLVCVSAPSNDWAQGVESLVFERMNGIASDELARFMTISGSLSPGSPTETESSYQQDFRATGQSGAAVKQDGARVLQEEGALRKSTRLSVMGRHTVAFSLKEPQPVVLMCSFACAEPADSAGATCANVLANHELDGELGPEPTPTLRARFAVGFARRPAAMAGVAAGLLSLLLGVLAVVRGLLISPRAGA